MKKKDSNKKIFKPRARMLLQLGDQLIKNENIAIVELVKNSYDADANICNLILHNIDDTANSKIIIKDDGVGMVPKVVEDVWLEPGADFKELISNGQLDLFEYGYEKSERRPIGEKGIGRFGVHKLGNHIKLITKNKYSSEEVVIEIDWDEFSKSKYLEDAEFKVEKREPKHFLNGKCGTHITVSKIRTNWTLNKYRELYKTINSLNSPFSSKADNDFEVKLDLQLADKEKQDKWNEKMLTVNEIKDLSLWKFKCTLSGNQITKIDYVFTPYKGMDLLSSRSFSEKQLNINDLILRDLIKEDGFNNFALDEHRIGDIDLEMYAFYRSSKILKYGVPDAKQLNTFMSDNGGIRVYRENMRVYNYGESEDDWLGLDQKRVSHVGQNIGNKIILGAISINKKNSKDLIEKTNREGFVENDAYLAFKNSILCAIDLFSKHRNIDKTHIKDFYESSAGTQPVVYEVDRLTDITERLVSFAEDLPEEQKEQIAAFETEILSGLKDLKKQYISTHEKLLKSAGAGLNLSVVVHEIEKRIKELEKVVNELDIDNLDKNQLIKVSTLVISISKLISNYGSLVSAGKKQKFSLYKLVDDSLFNTEFRFKAHNTEVINRLESIESPAVNCTQNIIIGAILNIFDNSLYWLNYYNILEPKILIDTKDYGDEVGLIIADNGHGFTIDILDAIKPFISMKSPAGMGLGLHIVDEMMKLQDGRLLIRNSTEVDLPESFSRGAVVELILKK